MPGFDNNTVYADNVDFRGVQPVVGQITTNGQLLIGSTASPNIRAGSLASAGGTITITTGAGTINLEAAGAGSNIQTITGNSGGAQSPSANNFNIVGTGS